MWADQLSRGNTSAFDSMISGPINPRCHCIRPTHHGGRSALKRGDRLGHLLGTLKWGHLSRLRMGCRRRERTRIVFLPAPLTSKQRLIKKKSKRAICRSYFLSFAACSLAAVIKILTCVCSHFGNPPTLPTQRAEHCAEDCIFLCAKVGSFFAYSGPSLFTLSSVFQPTFWRVEGSQALHVYLPFRTAVPVAVLDIRQRPRSFIHRCY